MEPVLVDMCKFYHLCALIKGDNKIPVIFGRTARISGFRLYNGISGFTQLKSGPYW